ncbi:hypothetical protein [Laspinema palackyanum]
MAQGSRSHGVKIGDRPSSLRFCDALRGIGMRKSLPAIGTQPGSRHRCQDLIHKIPEKIIFSSSDRVRSSPAIASESHPTFRITPN